MLSCPSKLHFLHASSSDPHPPKLIFIRIAEHTCFAIGDHWLYFWVRCTSSHCEFIQSRLKLISFLLPRSNLQHDLWMDDLCWADVCHHSWIGLPTCTRRRCWCHSDRYVASFVFSLHLRLEIDLLATLACYFRSHPRIFRRRQR